MNVNKQINMTRMSIEMTKTWLMQEYGWMMDEVPDLHLFPNSYKCAGFAQKMAHGPSSILCSNASKGLNCY